MKTVLVVGGGPAGASAALGLLGLGMDVTILERRPTFGPRVCGAFLDEEAVSHLNALGLENKVRALGVEVVSTWVSTGSGKERRLGFPASGLALPRPDLERLLLDAVKERGGKLRWGVAAKTHLTRMSPSPLEGESRDGGGVDGGRPRLSHPPPRSSDRASRKCREGEPPSGGEDERTIFTHGKYNVVGNDEPCGRRRHEGADEGRAEGPGVVSVQGPGLTPAEPRELFADMVVWADGRFSCQGSPAIVNRSPAWYGWNASFSGIAQAPGEMSLTFLPNGYVGILTFKDGTSNLCGLIRRQESPLDWDTVFEEARDQSPPFRRRTDGAMLLTPWRGVGPLPFTGGLRPDDGMIRVGDAAAVGDPFMGEGIGRALASGPLLTQAWTQQPTHEGFNDTVRRLWNVSYGRRFQLGNGFRWILNHPWVARPALSSVLLRPSASKILLSLFHGYSK